MVRADAEIQSVRSHAFSIPTDAPEADGTFAWDSTTLVIVEVDAGGQTGLGYTYTDATAAAFVVNTLAEVIEGRDAFDVPACWNAMRRRVRNIGIEGLAATAISAVDVALWDLKAKLLDLPLTLLFGRLRDSVPIYGSGGFTTYSDERLAEQLRAWVERDGCRAVKMKIGANPAHDPYRVKAAKQAIEEAALFIDANGAFTPQEALRLTEAVRDQDVPWFEEPVPSDNLAGLRFVRDRAPGGINIAAGEYGYTPAYFQRMLEAGSVDVLQADATRCLGFTGFLQVAALCDIHGIDLSGHCAPALHLPVATAAPRLRHLEWFHDHVRIEAMLFDGAPEPQAGEIAPALDRPGLGLTFKAADARRFAVEA